MRLTPLPGCRCGLRCLIGSLDQDVPGVHCRQPWLLPIVLLALPRFGFCINLAELKLRE